MTDDPRLSDEGYVAGLAGGAALSFALFAAIAGESAVVVILALLAGVLGVGAALRDALRDRVPGRSNFLSMGALAAGGALASLPAERWFTAAGLGLVAVMALARGFGWRVTDDIEEETEGAANVED